MDADDIFDLIVGLLPTALVLYVLIRGIGFLIGHWHQIWQALIR